MTYDSCLRHNSNSSDVHKKTLLLPSGTARRLICQSRSSVLSSNITRLLTSCCAFSPRAHESFQLRLFWLAHAVCAALSAWNLPEYASLFLVKNARAELLSRSALL